MTIEDHLRRLIGDLIFTMAKLSAENDALSERLKGRPRMAESTSESQDPKQTYPIDPPQGPGPVDPQPAPKPLQPGGEPQESI